MSLEGRPLPIVAVCTLLPRQEDGWTEEGLQVFIDALENTARLAYGLTAKPRRARDESDEPLTVPSEWAGSPNLHERILKVMHNDGGELTREEIYEALGSKAGVAAKLIWMARDGVLVFNDPWYSLPSSTSKTEADLTESTSDGSKSCVFEGCVMAAIPGKQVCEDHFVDYERERENGLR